MFVTQSSRPGAVAFRRTLDMRDGHPAALLRPAESSGGYDAPPPSVPVARLTLQMLSGDATDFHKDPKLGSRGLILSHRVPSVDPWLSA